MPQSIGERFAARARAETPTAIPLSAMLVVKGHYDFAVQGGAVGPIGITDDTPIPDGAIIVGGFVEVTGQVLAAGGAATFALSVEAAGDIVAAEAKASWTVGRKNVLPAATTGQLTAATSVKTTALRDIVLTVATNPITAGVFDVYLFVIVP